MTSACLRRLVPPVTPLETRVCLCLALPGGSPSCPFEGFMFPTASPLGSLTTGSGAGFSYLLAIAYDYDVLGLGPDSPWDDWRCPGTLRLSVWVVLTPMTLLIPAFALVCAPPVFAIRLPCTHNAPLPSPAHSARLTLASLALGGGGDPELRYDA